MRPRHFPTSHKELPNKNKGLFDSPALNCEKYPF